MGTTIITATCECCTPLDECLEENCGDAFADDPPATLYLTYTSLTPDSTCPFYFGCTPTFSTLPNPIPLTYMTGGPFGGGENGWYSTCYESDSGSCATPMYLSFSIQCSDDVISYAFGLFTCCSNNGPASSPTCSGDSFYAIYPSPMTVAMVPNSVSGTIYDQCNLLPCKISGTTRSCIGGEYCTLTMIGAVATS
jgi:hypothetical protein